MVKWNNFDVEDVTLDDRMILAEVSFYEKDSRDILLITRSIFLIFLPLLVTPYSLNASMNWDSDFFSKLKFAFLNSPKDVKFTIEKENKVKELHNISDGIKRQKSDLFFEEEDDNKQMIFRMEMLASTSYKINWIKSDMTIKIQTI